MASPTPQGADSLSVAEIDYFIRGCHIYKNDWIPFSGKHLFLRREPDNPKDKSAVAVIKDGKIVGHIPYNMSNI